MIGTKNPFVVNRTTYAFKGKWQKPNNDYAENIYYFVSQPMTLVSRFYDGLERLTPQIEITIYGEHPIAEKDYFTLQSGEKYRITGITLNYKEHNIAVRDMLKQVVESMVLVLE